MRSLYTRCHMQTCVILYGCVNSECYTVKVVARHVIQHGYMLSPVRRSALYCGLRFKFDIARLLDPRFDYCNLA